MYVPHTCDCQMHIHAAVCLVFNGEVLCRNFAHQVVLPVAQAPALWLAAPCAAASRRWRPSRLPTPLLPPTRMRSCSGQVWAAVAPQQALLLAIIGVWQAGLALAYRLEQCLSIPAPSLCSFSAPAVRQHAGELPAGLAKLCQTVLQPSAGTFEVRLTPACLCNSHSRQRCAGSSLRLL